MNSFFDEVLVVLVIYQVKITESPAYRSLTEGLSEAGPPVTLFVYDNSSRSQEPPVNSRWHVRYSHDPHNSGVSKAYNTGLEIAKLEHKKWLLLADQDTVFPNGILEKYFHAIRSATCELILPIARYRSTIISPFRFELGRGRSLLNVKPGRYSLRSYNFINSGLLVSAILFEKCGGYDERFPLDFSDIAFAKRVSAFINEFEVVDALCIQPLSAGEASLEAALNRFMIFARASRQYGKVYGSSLFLLLNRFFRAVKLGVRFNTIRFLKLLLKD